MSKIIDKIKLKVLEIQYLAVLCEEHGQHCFANYSPHVPVFNVSIHKGKWTKDHDPYETLDTTIYFEERQEYLDLAEQVVTQLGYFLATKGVRYKFNLEV